MAERIKVALIGANSRHGWSSAAHLPALSGHRMFELYAVCTTNAESARETSARYSVPHAFSDVDGMLSLPDVELVVVSVKAPLHAVMVKRAAAARKHVLCEWPLGRNTQQSIELLDCVRSEGVRHFVCLQGQAAAPLRHMRALIGDGYLGEVLSATLTSAHPPWGEVMPPRGSYLADASNGATVSTIIGGHALDMLCACIGELASVRGMVANRRTQTRTSETGAVLQKTAPDQLLLMGTLANGAPVSVHIQGGVTARDYFEFTVYGTMGTLRLTSPAVPEILPGTLWGTRSAGASLEPLTLPAALVPAALAANPAANMAGLYNQIADDLRQGSRTAPDFEHAVRRRRLIDSIEEGLPWSELEQARCA